MLSAFDRNDCPASIGIPVRHRRNPHNVANTAPSTAVASATTPTNNDIKSFFDTLIKRHDAWDNGVRKISKQELYGILADCMALAEQILANRQYTDLDAELARRNFTTSANTSVITRVLRCVFNTQHRSLNAYAATVKIAMSNKQTSETFVAWLNKHGGIDAVRRTFAKNKKQSASPSELQRAAKNHLATAPALAKLNKDNVANCAAPHNSGFIVSIARVTKNGDYEVIASTVDNTAVRAALIDWGKFITTNKISEGEEQSVRNRTEKLAEALAA